MGAANLKKSATAKLIAEFPVCALCGGDRPSTTRDHIPPKALFDNSHRPDKLVVPACDTCNRTTSSADLVASIASRFNYHSDQQELKDYRRLLARLRKQCPDVVTEWTSMSADKRQRARQHLLNHGVNVPIDAGFVTVGTATIRQLNLFSYKLALGFFFEHFNATLPNTGLVSAIWRTKEDFAGRGIPQELLQIMPRYATLQQGKWDVSKEFEYRYDLNEAEGLVGCFARLRTSLFVTTFAVRDAAVLPEDERTLDWIRPNELLSILDRDEFMRRIQ